MHFNNKTELEVPNILLQYIIINTAPKHTNEAQLTFVTETTIQCHLSVRGTAKDSFQRGTKFRVSIPFLVSET